MSVDRCRGPLLGLAVGDPLGTTSSSARPGPSRGGDPRPPARALYAGDEIVALADALYALAGTIAR